MTINIFISYSQEDYRAGTRQVRNYLSRHIQDSDVFLDQYKTKGNKWKKEIESKLRESEIFIVILTHAALTSNEVRKEVEIAKENKDRKIIPCKDELLEMKWSKMPWHLNEYDGIEFDDKEELSRRLVTEIKKILKESEPAPKILKLSMSSHIKLIGAPNRELNYSITNGELISAKLDREASSIIISLASYGDGNLKLTLPRNIIDAKIENQDDDLLLLMDGEEIESDFELKATNFERILKIPFQKGNNEIEIVGTQLLGLSYIGKMRNENIVKILKGSLTPRKDEKYLQPRQLVIKIGEKVKWINEDSAAHTITSGTPDNGPDGHFDSSLFLAEDTFEIAFHQKGTYRYFDMVHPWIDGMIVVSKEIDSIQNK